MIIIFLYEKIKKFEILFLGLASTYPEPEDKRHWLEEQLYNFNYESSMPVTWPWPAPKPLKSKIRKTADKDAHI